ncbi:MAG: hypothetical protein PHS95_02220 [Candidatus Pacebacteria bacterium]|nr:hypothetical protein [Candidatus Paceibacterota bacterium]
MDVVIKNFESFFGEHGRHYSEFYVGIATDPKSTLFERHAVNEINDAWIHSTNAFASSVVRAAEKFFLDKGARGGEGGGDNNTCYIYAYKITPSTRQ